MLLFVVLQIVVPDIFWQLLQIIVLGRGGRLVKVVRVVRSGGRGGHSLVWLDDVHSEIIRFTWT